jgi:hypothetical protein
MWPFRTAAMSLHPARDEITDVFTFFPHHDARINSGFRFATSSA